MRNIKFRAWDKKKNDWFDDDDGELYIELNGNIYFGWNGEVMDDYADRVILLQYTGLKDKKGVEIYEGDILFHPLQGRRKVYYPYSERVASYGLRDIDNGFGSTLQDSHAVWEVIGNVWEDGDLIDSERTKTY